MNVKFEDCIIAPNNPTGMLINPREDGSVVLMIVEGGKRVTIAGSAAEFAQLGTTFIQNSAVAAFVATQKKGVHIAGAGPAVNGGGASPSRMG